MRRQTFPGHGRSHDCSGHGDRGDRSDLAHHLENAGCGGAAILMNRVNDRRREGRRDHPEPGARQEFPATTKASEDNQALAAKTGRDEPMTAAPIIAEPRGVSPWTRDGTCAPTQKAPVLSTRISDALAADRPN